MLQRSLLRHQSKLMSQLPQCLFSTEVTSTDAAKHAVKHYGDPNEPKMFETDF